VPVHSQEEAKKCANFLLRQGIKRVVLTLGARGCLLAGPEGTELIPAFTVSAVDTTGAGDAFIGSFAVFLGEGFSEKEALARANLYAALSTTRVGTQKSFVNRVDFEREWQIQGTRA
jgi:ribokinase